MGIAVPINQSSSFVLRGEKLSFLSFSSFSLIGMFWVFFTLHGAVCFLTSVFVNAVRMFSHMQ